MSLDQKITDRINAVLKTRRLDPHLKKDFISIIKPIQNREFQHILNVSLTDEVNYLTEGNPSTIPNDMTQLVDNKYVGKSTYLQLLEHVESGDFSYFEKGQKMEYA